jgi:hypothetical protein
MDTNNKTFEDLVRERAHQIYIRRTKSPIWQFGQLGTKEGDWRQAEREIQKEYSAVTNRIKDLI